MYHVVAIQRWVAANCQDAYQIKMAHRDCTNTMWPFRWLLCSLRHWFPGSGGTEVKKRFVWPSERHDQEHIMHNTADDTCHTDVNKVRRLRGQSRWIAGPLVRGGEERGGLDEMSCVLALAGPLAWGQPILIDLPQMTWPLFRESPSQGPSPHHLITTLFISSQAMNYDL